MDPILNMNSYQEALSRWAGYRVKPTDDFESLCDCDFDFIELLLLFETRFTLNLVESTAVRQDFGKVNDFISWAISQPNQEGFDKQFRYFEPEVIAI